MPQPLMRSAEVVKSPPPFQMRLEFRGKFGGGPRTTRQRDTLPHGQVEPLDEGGRQLLGLSPAILAQDRLEFGLDGGALALRDIARILSSLCQMQRCRRVWANLTSNAASGTPPPS